MTKIDSKALEAAFTDASAKDQRCNFGRLLDTCEPDVRKVIEDKVKDDLHYSAALIARVLKGMGFPSVSSDAISAHRKSACRCM